MIGELFSNCKRDSRDHITEYSNNIFGVSDDNFIKIRCILNIHKIKYTCDLQYLYECLRFARMSRGNQPMIMLYKNM